jgi:hypothetical protein
MRSLTTLCALVVGLAACGAGAGATPTRPPLTYRRPPAPPTGMTT